MLARLGKMRTLGCLAIIAGALSFGTTTPAGAHASSKDYAATHAYLVAGYAALHTTVSTWSKVEANIHALDLKFRAQCPNVAAGSPQNEPEQKLSYEVAGALWATGYHTDANVVSKFLKAVEPLKWSNGAVTRAAHDFATALHEMTALSVPDMCGDVRAWSATAFKVVPPSTLSYDQHVESIEPKEIPEHLLAPYVQPSDKALFARDEHLNTQWQNLETERGFEDWNTLLETLGLNQ